MRNVFSKFAFTASLVLALAFTTYCDSGLTDSRDKKSYKTIKIGSQVWMAENLNYDREGVCYGNDPANCQKYGRLYNWKTALSVCPKGWHLPTDAEWENLVQFVGGSEVAGNMLKSSSGWEENDGNGEDKFGFSALPGGYGNSGGSFYGVGDGGIWWSATERNAPYAWAREMGGYFAEVGRRDDGYDKSGLFSVRCAQD